MAETGLQNCFVQIGKWAYANAGRAREVYSELYGIYLTEGTTDSVVVPGLQSQRPAPTPRPARRVAQTQPAPRQRNRATPGSPGNTDGQVLAKIVASPGITIEPLRRYFEAPSREIGSNILGTCLGRLMRAGRINGTPKVGPFTATAMGVEAAKKVTSINTRRRASSKAATGATAAETTEQAAAAG
jgi:hypothetical protein